MYNIWGRAHRNSFGVGPKESIKAISIKEKWLPEKGVGVQIGVTKDEYVENERNQAESPHGI